MEALKQYEIWWAELPRPVGRRPELLLSRDGAYELLNKFIAAEITTTIRGIPIEVRLGKAEGLDHACVVNCDNIRTISKALLRVRIGRLARRRVGEVKRALGYALEWEELIGAAEQEGLAGAGSASPEILRVHCLRQFPAHAFQRVLLSARSSARRSIQPPVTAPNQSRTHREAPPSNATVRGAIIMSTKAPASLFPAASVGSTKAPTAAIVKMEAFWSKTGGRRRTTYVTRVASVVMADNPIIA